MRHGGPLVLALLLGGCSGRACSGSGETATDPSAAQLVHAPVVTNQAVVAPVRPVLLARYADAAVPAIALPAAGPDAPAGDLAEAGRGSNALGVDVYQRLRATPGNLAFSPASLTVAFGMASAGARGATLAEMRRVLHAGLPEARLHAALGTLVRQWQAPAGAPVEMAVANRLYGQQGLAFQPDFWSLTARDYRAPLEAVDFAQPEAVRARINAWVVERTRQRVPDLVPPDGLTTDTRLVLVNAMYFQGRWAQPFRVAMTHDEPFHPGGAATTVAVPTLHQVTSLPYAARDGVQVVELAYQDTPVAMSLLVPDRVDGLPALEARLSATTLAGWLDGLSPRPVDLRLPRFRLQPAAPLRLAALFRELGLRLAFTAGQADFTGIADPPLPQDRLSLGEVFHKAFVEVDEAGTEAAAATAISMARGGRGPAADLVQLRVDRPFLFVIRDRSSGTVLFLGRVDDPR